MKRLTCVVLTVLALALPLLPSPAPAAETVRIGIVQPSPDTERYRPLLAHLDGGGDGHFEIAPYPTVDELYGAFTRREVRLAIFGSVFYAKAHRETGLVPLVKDRSNISTIVVPERSPITRIEDLRGKRLALGYEESTTSNLIPRLVLWQHKIMKKDLTDSPRVLASDPDKVLFTYTGSHTAVIEKVLGGGADAGAVVDAIFENNKHRGLRAIFTSEPYPGVPLTCSKDEPAAFRDRVRRLFLSWPGQKTGERYHFENGATAADDSDYDPVRYLCNVVLGDNYPVR